MSELYRFLFEIKKRKAGGFTKGTRDQDFFGTDFFVFFLTFIFYVLFMNGKTALITTNNLHFIVYKEKIIYHDFIRVL